MLHVREDPHVECFEIILLRTWLCYVLPNEGGVNALHEYTEYTYRNIVRNIWLSTATIGPIIFLELCPSGLRRILHSGSTQWLDRGFMACHHDRFAVECAETRVEKYRA